MMENHPYEKLISQMERNLRDIDAELSKAWLIDLSKFDQLRFRVDKAISQIEQAQHTLALISLSERANLWEKRHIGLERLLTFAKSIREKINKKDFLGQLLETGKTVNTGVGIFDSLVNTTKKFVDFFRSASRKLLGSGRDRDDE